MPTVLAGDLGNRPGDRIGPYKLLEMIGEGGFGVVWMAERREPFFQRVALKIIKPGMDSRGVLARFDQERQALAVMDHPNVARVLDGGLTSPGQGSRPYFVMEFVKGEPITEYSDRNRLTVRQRLELFIPVCEAVQHAHHKGIIHRDIKPSNVLVTVLEGRLAPKVIDFGVAKAVSHTLTHQTILTEHGQLIGTPEYMSPEQAEMGGTDVDTRTDVYSLGVLLYELLTGTLPFEATALRSAAIDEIRRIIREDEPPKPSTRLTTLDAATALAVAGRRQADREQLATTLRRELDWIPLKGMRKDRARRYATPEAMAEDIQRYLEDKPIEAAPESRVYLIRKLARRHKGALAAVAMIVLTLLGGVVASSVFAAQAQVRRHEADKARDEAQRERQRAEESLAELSRQKASADKVAELVELLGRAQKEMHEGGEGKAQAELTERLNSGEIGGLPKMEILIRCAYAEALSTDEMGGSDEARVLIEGAIEIAVRTYGEDHPITVRLLHDAAKASLAAENYEAASQWFDRWLGMLRTLSPGDHIETVDAMVDAAYAKYAEGKFEEEQSLYRQAEAMARRLWPNDGGSLLRALAAHVQTLRNRADQVGADAVEMELVAVYASPLYVDTDNGQALVTIAQNFEGRNRFDLAERAWSALVDLRARTLPATNWYVPNARSRLGGSLLGQAKFASAEGHLVSSFEAMKGLADIPYLEGEDRLLEACQRVGALYERWDAAEPGKGLQAKASEWKAKAEAIAADHAAQRDAQQKAEAAKNEAFQLNSAAWSLVVTAEAAAKAGPEKLAEALRDATRAVELSPVADYLNTLGAAQFRVGEYEKCVQTMMRAEAAYLNVGEGEQQDDWVFIAMAYHRLGKDQEAQAARAKYRELSAKPGQRGQSADWTAWVSEIETEFAPKK